MPDLDDHELLAEYDRDASEAAFATLVERYVNLVYSAALRFTGNPHHAEEITQAVFIILARKAGGLRRSVVLSGWLYQTARLTAANFVKGEIRRQRREQEAYMESTLTESNAGAWEQIAPLLDEAMGHLGDSDRNAIVLRFFENKTAQEIAAKLKLNEEAAHKRVSRALERLRKFFVKRGVDSTTATLAETISANSVHPAPIALAKTVTAVALTKGATASASTLTLIKGALKIMAWTKIKTAAVVVVGVLLAAGTSTVTVKEIQNHDTNHQIAMALLRLHHQWAANGYHASHSPPPPILNKGQVHAWSAGILGAYVEYDYQTNGIEWTRRFHILRANTNTTVWTLYEIAEPNDTNLVRMAWQHKLITVSGEP